MFAIHDTKVKKSLHSRADSLRAGTAGLWGNMSLDQMLWHVNGALSMGLGKLRTVPVKSPIPKVLIRPMALYAPWPKGKARTVPELRATGQYDIDDERQRFHVLVDEFADRPLHFSWLDHPILGRLNGPQWSRLEAKHVDHHFRQFGV